MAKRQKMPHVGGVYTTQSNLKLTVFGERSETSQQLAKKLAEQASVFGPESNCKQENSANLPVKK